MTTINSTATKINTGISTVANALVSGVEKLIIADVPVLGLPVINIIWEALFGWITGYFIKILETGATFLVIDLQVDSEEAGVSKELAAVIAAEKGGNPNAIQAAIEAYANAQSALIHNDGSAAPST